jgi:hypothetical protein
MKITTEYMLAECAIRRLQAEYCDAVWRLDFDAFGNCFTEDCEWRFAGDVLHGRKAIVEYSRKLMVGKFRGLFVTLRTPMLEVEGGKASGRTYFSAQNILADGRPYYPFGVYYERFVDDGDQWRFSWRFFQTLYAGPPDLSGPLFKDPGFGPPPGFPPDDVPTYNLSGLQDSRNFPPEGHPNRKPIFKEDPFPTKSK